MYALIWCTRVPNLVYRAHFGPNLVYNKICPKSIGTTLIRRIRCRWGIAALGRRQVGVAVGLRNVIVVASLQPGAGSGVGGKGR